MSDTAQNRWHKIIGGQIVDTVRAAPKDIARDAGGNPVWRREWHSDRDAAVGPDQIKDGPVRVIERDRVVDRWTVRDLTLVELDDRRRRAADDYLRNAVVELGRVQIKLIDGLLANGTIAVTDFDAATRQNYLDLKAMVERLAP